MAIQNKYFTIKNDGLLFQIISIEFPNITKVSNYTLFGIHDLILSHENDGYIYVTSDVFNQLQKNMYLQN